MTDQFTDTWQKQLLRFERSSIFALEPLPADISEESVIDFIARNKQRQRLGSHPLLWIGLIWLPILSITGLACFFFVQYAKEILPSILSVISIEAAIFLFHLLIPTPFNLIDLTLGNLWSHNGGFTITADNHFSVPNKWYLRLLKDLQTFFTVLGFVLLCPIILPFLPLLKIRQLQKQYSAEYWNSFRCVFWRSGYAVSHLIDNPDDPNASKTFQGLTKLDYHSAILSYAFGYLSLQGLFHWIHRLRSDSAQKLCRVLLIPFYPALTVIMIMEFLYWKWSPYWYVETLWRPNSPKPEKDPSVPLDFYRNFRRSLLLYRWFFRSFWPIVFTILYLWNTVIPQIF